MNDEIRRYHQLLEREHEEAVRNYVKALTEIGATFEDGEYKTVPILDLEDTSMQTHEVVDRRGTMVYSGPEQCCQWFADEANLYWSKHLMTQGTKAENHSTNSWRYRR